jgi:hypothetical protein
MSVMGRARCPMTQFGQARETRLSRLADGRCPIHGIPMKLIGEANGLRVVRCPRVRCNVIGVQKPPGRAVRLSAKDQHLLSVARDIYVPGW